MKIYWRWPVSLPLAPSVPVKEPSSRSPLMIALAEYVASSVVTWKASLGSDETQPTK